VLSSHVMPDGKQQAAFIWYHADASLTDALQTWVEQTGKALAIPSRLMVRRQDDRTTFMEIYESTGEEDMEAIVASVEASAAMQAWFVKLHSQRKAEIFSAIPSQSETSG
jgi:hypothetical protein